MALTTTSTKRLGLILDWVAAGFQGDIVAGAWKAAQQRGANLLVFYGGPFQDERLAHPLDAVYALARRPLVDGVVGVLGTMLGPLDGPGCGRALASLHLPSVSVGVPLDTMPSFCVDNRESMAELTGHLVEAHGYRRLAIIAAATHSRESEDRVAACRQTLEDYGLTLPSSHVVHTGFNMVDGERGVSELLGQRSLDVASLDAILCVNDLVAMGALRELTRRGISVPDDIGVTGFDGLEQTRYLTPALTTVDQPFEELGYQAALTILQQLDGLESRGPVRVQGTLLVRGSCGCMESTGADTGLLQRPKNPRGVSGLLPYRDVLAATLARVAQGRLAGAGRGWEERWIMALLRDLQAPGNELTQELQKTLRDVGTERSHLELCQRLLDTLRTSVLDQGVEPNIARSLEDQLHRAQRLTGAAIERFEINSRIASSDTLYAALWALEHTIDHAGQEGFWDCLESALQRLGIHTCLVSRRQSDMQSNVVFAMGEVLSDAGARAGTTFPATHLLPGAFLHKPRGCPYAIRALSRRGNVTGTLVVSATAHDCAVYGPVAAAIALHLELTTRGA